MVEFTYESLVANNPVTVTLANGTFAIPDHGRPDLAVRSER